MAIDKMLVQIQCFEMDCYSKYLTAQELQKSCIGACHAIVQNGSRHACPGSVSEHSTSVPGAMNTSTSSNANTGVVAIARQDPRAIDGRTASAADKLDADFSKVLTKIHRFPGGLQGIDGSSYVVPSVVAIGPYYRRSDAHHHLQKMEEVKLAAAHHLCTRAGRSTAEVYEKVLSVVSDARGCYDADDQSVADVGNAEFAEMMFLDGCFLLQYMVGDTTPVLQNRMMLSTGPSIQKDIFLLENQIPWLVLEVLTEFMSVDVLRFVAGIEEKFFDFFPAKAKKGRRRRPMPTSLDQDPPHLLGLLRLTQLGRMPETKMKYKSFASTSLSVSISAVELAEIGVRLTPSTEPWFGDMSFSRGPLFGELSLSPLFLNDVTACWLVNMAALEASTSGSGAESDGYVVSSYLSVLAMLMDREEDVQQLRAKRLVYSTLSNTQALGFFKGLAQHLRFGDHYFVTLEEIEAYKRHRSVRIFVHRHLYHGYKAMTIATLFSIVGVLVGILKIMLDNNNNKIHNRFF
ncbi:UPF0481 protein At3g47200-like [Miscanthus floridulus]|uniref:UPF0481 protein At3g47200-like n=1 Tax=Miscanthus floridulus TaxID=154761 RepID=UPI0034577768